MNDYIYAPEIYCLLSSWWRRWWWSSLLQLIRRTFYHICEKRTRYCVCEISWDWVTNAKERHWFKTGSEYRFAVKKTSGQMRIFLDEIVSWSMHFWTIFNLSLCRRQPNLLLMKYWRIPNQALDWKNVVAKVMRVDGHDDIMGQERV